MALPDTIAVVQATLAPAFLITSTSVFLNFTQTRLFRVVDRVRALAPEEGSAKPALVQRARLLRDAIFLGVLAVAFTVVTAILLMAGQQFGAEGVADAAPVALALAMVALLAAMGFVLWDTVLSVRTVAALVR